MKTLRKLILLTALLSLSLTAAGAEIQFTLRLKSPGNDAVTYQLQRQGNRLKASDPLPLEITTVTTADCEDLRLSVTLTARKRTWFNLGVLIPTDYATDDCDFYLPGFWYHKNLRSPREAPSFHTSKDWNFREDRLSSPLTGVYCNGSALTVMHEFTPSTLTDALTTHQEGEVILGGPTSIGYMGFEGSSGHAALSFGYPYMETPRRYIRKLTLINPITTFARLESNESITLSWLIHETKPADYG